MASTADCKNLIDRDPAVAQMGGKGPWGRRSKKKVAGEIERVFANAAGTCFVRVVEDAGGQIRVDKIGTSLSAVQADPPPSLFDRFPPTPEETAHNQELYESIANHRWTGRVLFDLETADGEELDDDEVAFYCGYEVDLGDVEGATLNTNHSEGIALLLAHVFAAESLDGRLRVEDAESFHTVLRAPGQSRSALKRHIRQVLNEAGAVAADKASPEPASPAVPERSRKASP